VFTRACRSGAESSFSCLFNDAVSVAMIKGYGAVGGMKIGRRKLGPISTPTTTNPTLTDLESNPGRRQQLTS
jgi:hypothetical protein